ncbi:serine protease [Demequina capsici]|uniref:Serine protease n=1 Tax=Demequina capsici TaxID=3075620 RepID=A0AA96F3J2_9MICO|nr:serine protease [Demequina sp. OYTSA14]WNM23319.1 serine protease [Demequina sp. OYTSA14]
MRRLPLAALAVSCALVTGCSVLPSGPTPMPSDWIPQSSISPAARSGAMSPDGFSVAQRMTVRVRNIGCGFIATGTGFAYDDSTLITNRHVIEDSRSIEVSTYNGDNLNATAVSSTTVADIAIVRTNQAVLSSYAILAQQDPEPGDVITVIGYPNGGELTSVSGVVLGSTADPLDAAIGKVLVTSAEVEPGSSGSPVLSEDGEVVGVVYAKTDDGNSLIVPVSTLRTLLSETSLLVPEAPSCTTSAFDGSVYAGG